MSAIFILEVKYGYLQLQLCLHKIIDVRSGKFHVTYLFLIIIGFISVNFFLSFYIEAPLITSIIWELVVITINRIKTYFHLI